MQNLIRLKVKLIYFVFAVSFLLIFCNKPPININAAEIKVSDEWNTPQKVPPPVSSPRWEDGPSISPDGNTLYYSIGRDRNVKTYFSRKTEKGWGNPLEIDINIESFPTGAPHTQDGKTLYISSLRPGVFGLGDIFVSIKNKNGEWKKIKNLGKTINTKYMESEPFIAKDNKTLYFASTRKGGKGSTDIWMAKKTTNGWTKPLNLESPVNSKLEESQPFVTHDGKELYFMAVNRKGIPGPAIFRSIKQGKKWTEPDLVISGFVGEPTLTADSQYLYFVHLIMKNGKLTDAEIMYAQRKQN